MIYYYYMLKCLFKIKISFLYKFIKNNRLYNIIIIQTNLSMTKTNLLFKIQNNLFYSSKLFRKSLRDIFTIVLSIIRVNKSMF